MRPPSQLRNALLRAPLAIAGRDSRNPTRFKGRETILMVDDLAIVREFATEALRSFGYHVIAVGTTDEAVLALADPSLAVEALVTDLLVPSQGGEVLSAEARRLRPGIKILLVSGHDERLRAAQSSEQFGLDFLAKPFGPEELAFSLRRLLDTKVASSPTAQACVSPHRAVANENPGGPGMSPERDEKTNRGQA